MKRPTPHPGTGTGHEPRLDTVPTPSETPAKGRDLSHLPTKGGHTPAPVHRFLTVLPGVLATGDRPTARGTPVRVSDSGKCARALSMTAAGYVQEPMDDTGKIATGLGTLMHDLFQAALTDQHADDPNVTVTHEVIVEPLPGVLSGHADSMIEYHDDESGEVHRVVAEWKTVGGYKYKKSVGGFAADADGPDYAHLLQGSICAYALDADELVIGYICKEAISVGQAARQNVPGPIRWGAEWTFDRDVFVPLAKRELERLAAIADLVDTGGMLARAIVPDPEIPPGAEITKPSVGLWEVKAEDGSLLDHGNYWGCGYCGHQTNCALIGPGRQPVTVAVDQ